MSNRSLIELNHDYLPSDDSMLWWFDRMTSFMRSGDPKELPEGVKFLNMRHHAEPPIAAPDSDWPVAETPGVVCALCGSPVGWVEKESVWRHAGDPRSSNDKFFRQTFCDKYGYPIPVCPAASQPEGTAPRSKKPEC